MESRQNIGLLQDRIPKSVFVGNYLKIEYVREVVKKGTVETENLGKYSASVIQLLPFECFLGKDTCFLSLSFIFFCLSICLCFSSPSRLVFLLLDILIHP